MRYNLPVSLRNGHQTEDLANPEKSGGAKLQGPTGQPAAMFDQTRTAQFFIAFPLRGRCREGQSPSRRMRCSRRSGRLHHNPTLGKAGAIRWRKAKGPHAGSQLRCSTQREQSGFFISPARRRNTHYVAPRDEVKPSFTAQSCRRSRQFSSTKSNLAIAKR